MIDRLSRSDECYRCGYDLRGIADDQPCPECGLLALRSRHETDELFNTRPRWLRGISWGVNLILASVLAMAAGPLVKLWLGPIIRDWVIHRYGPNPTLAHYYIELKHYFSTLVFAPAALFLFLGVFLLTLPEGYAPADIADGKLRRRLRIVAIVPALILLVLSISDPVARLLAGRAGYQDSVAQTAALGASSLSIAALSLFLFWRLRHLAKRARSPYLPRGCRIVGIGTSLIILCIPMIVLTADKVKSKFALMLLSGFIALALVFFLSALGLLMNFAMAFRRAALLRTEKWKRDDWSLSQA